MGGKSSAGKPPDYQALIGQQSQANQQSAQQTAELNRINQYTPYGSLTYNVSGKSPDGTPIYSQTQSLSPAQQKILDQQQQGALSLGNTANGLLSTIQKQQGIDYKDAPGLNSSVNNQGPNLLTLGNASTQAGQDASIKQAQDAAYKAQTQYLDPQFKQQQAQLDSSLINQGITQGSDAWKTAEQNLSLQKQQAYQGAQDSAVSAGNQQQNQLFGQQATGVGIQNQANQQGYEQALQSGQFGNQALQQYLQQQYAQANQPINQYAALMANAQVQNPSFQNYNQPNVATTDVGGIENSVYNQQMAYANQQNQGWNNLLSLGGQLGGAAMMYYSDRRVKRDVRRVGELSSGIPIYDFRYIGPDDTIYRGVMADEVLPVIPEAVHLGEDGFYRVDYARVK